MVPNANLSLDQGPDSTLRIELSGAWSLERSTPSLEPVERALTGASPPRRITLLGPGLIDWDSSLIAFVSRLRRRAESVGVATRIDGLPPGAQRLLKRARQDSRPPAIDTRAPWLDRVGENVVRAGSKSVETIDFLGRCIRAGGRLLLGRARFRRSDLLHLLEDCGARSLPVVGLIGFLVGLILAFVGAIQLESFGAQIYVANLVGVAMVREMGPIMAGILTAGRTGSGFAAELASMQVNEEADALTTLGIPTVEFLVLPRMLALCLMMPLLCLYADVLGVLGGFVVGVGLLELPPATYVDQTMLAVPLASFGLGLVKAMCFGILVSFCGCLHGMRARGGAVAVGAAATSAVVSGVVSIIVCDGIFAVLCQIVGV